ncbi:hypothetical protein ACYF6T_38965 [Streptomyces sp. 7R007]
MSPQAGLFTCPYGGCDAFGYCPCAEADPDDPGRVRDIDTLPPIDTYEPTQGS